MTALNQRAEVDAADQARAREVLLACALAGERWELPEPKAVFAWGTVLAAMHQYAAERVSAALETADAREERLREALEALVDAKALSGVRALVAGWNGEGRNDGPYDRHPSRLGARIETNCGRVYELDDAMMGARAALSEGVGR